MELNFEKMFYLLLRVMKINESYPYIPRDKKWALSFIVRHICIYTGVFSMLIHSVYHDLKNDDLSNACRNAVSALLYVINTFYCIIMLRYQNVLMNLMEAMKKDYESRIPPDVEIMMYYGKKGSQLCKLWAIFTTSGGIVYPASHIITSIYVCITDKCHLTNILQITYPSPIDDYKNNVFVYIILYVLVFFYCFYTVSFYIAFVPLEPVFMLHACGQFEIVKQRIDNLFKDSTEGEVQEKLRSIVAKLQNIYSFVGQMKKCFKEANEVTLKITPFLLPITYYELMESYHRGEMCVELISVLVGGVIISSVWCYYSDLLMEKGEDIALAVYTCGWESRYDRRTRTTLALVMLRAQVSVGMRAMFCTLCLDSLTNVFKQSYAIFNLMNAVWN